MEQNTTGTLAITVAEVKTEKVRTRKVSDIRTIPGAKAIRSKIAEVMNVHAEVMAHAERVVLVSAALGISQQKASEMLKNPAGMLDVTKLGAYIRAATFRFDLVLDSVKLCRIAQVIAENIGETNVQIPREKMKSVSSEDGK